MSPEAQNIAIAMECGWTQFPGESRRCYDPTGLSCYWSDAPDYFADLNAMHDAEKSIDGVTCLKYFNTLMGLCRYTVVAPAAQRAEAFLRTLGRWDDSK